MPEAGAHLVPGTWHRRRRLVAKTSELPHASVLSRREGDAPAESCRRQAPTWCLAQAQAAAVGGHPDEPPPGVHRRGRPDRSPQFCPALLAAITQTQEAQPASAAAAALAGAGRVPSDRHMLHGTGSALGRHRIEVLS